MHAYYTDLHRNGSSLVNLVQEFALE